MPTTNLTAEGFDEAIASNDIVLVDLWASWCGPCRMFAPIFADSSEQHPDITFAKVDTEAEPELARRFQVQSIPTLMAFRDQVLIFSQPGALPPAVLEQLITKIQELDMDEVRKQISAYEAAAP